MVAFLTTIAAFAAIASAVPHAHRHAHLHHVRDIEVSPAAAELAPLAGRSVSYDGSCGSWGGHTCPAGSCCGPNGWCGNGTEFCGTGCQTGFGECGNTAAQIAPASYGSSSAGVAAPSGSSAPASLQVSPNGLCGQDVGYTCSGSNFGDSCSKWNYCGSNSSYSGDGCQSQYGSCGQAVAAASSDASPTASAYSAPTTSASSSAQDGIHTKNPSPPAYGPPGYSAPQTTLVTKTLPASSSAAAATSAAQSSAPAYSAPPAYSSSAAASSAPASSAPADTATQAASSSAAAAETTSATSASGYSSSAPSYASPTASVGPYVKTYKGDGSTADGWPSQSDWLSFEELWSLNVPLMKQSCESSFGVPNNSDDEIDAISKAIEDQASTSKVNKSFILAIMMQESIGCVRAPTTSYSHANPGLFQSHAGQGTCNNAPAGTTTSAVTPCPDSEIDLMVSDGVSGTKDGDGLMQLLDSCQGTDAQAYYQTARKYNSGSIAAGGNLGQGVATHCYASDIANRLMGWSQGVTGCDANTVGS